MNRKGNETRKVRLRRQSAHASFQMVLRWRADAGRGGGRAGEWVAKGRWTDGGREQSKCGAEAKGNIRTEQNRKEKG